MVDLTFNGHNQAIHSVEELGQALDRFDFAPQFELWAFTPSGQSLCMLRHRDHALLMYLRHHGDSGFTSVGSKACVGAESYLLANGQTDEYPLSWCIDIEQCYKAVAYFFVNDGARPDWVNWHET